MTQIKPFRTIYYNQEKIEDLSKVVCPPYDVISSEEKIRYHNLHPFNYIYILLGLDKPSDNQYENKYTRAKKTFEEWQNKGVLKEDIKPCIYYYKQEYVLRGQKCSRMGFVALIRLQDKGASKIIPHENTHSEAKEDRLRLWRNIRVNCSPIFVCFSDIGKKVEKIFREKVMTGRPFMDLVDNEKIRHTLWRLDDEGLIGQIQDSLAGQHLFIADGHHRYETAMEYRKLVLSRKSKPTGEEPCNFIMSYFTNIDSRDLLILPIHRVIKKLRGKLNFLEEFFRIDKVGSREELAILLAKAGQNEQAFGMYTPEGIRLLRLKNRLLIDKHIHEGSREYRNLDATILKYFILDRIGVVSEDITYTKELNEAFAMVDDKRADLCFIMNPVKIQQLKAIALSGEKMPAKTTYFYPKVLSGLTINRISE